MKKYKIISFIIFILIIAAGYFTFIMNEPYMYDENMYVASGVLIQKYKLYTDFAYYQAPYQPIFMGIIYKLSGNNNYFIIGRLIQFTFAIISILLVYFIIKKFTKNYLPALLLMIIYGFNGVMIGSAGYINNSVIPVVFALLGFYFFDLYTLKDDNDQKNNGKGLFLSGILLAISTGLKIYYIILFPLFLLSALIYPLLIPLQTKIKKQCIPIFAGFMIGMVPFFYYLFADFDAFIFNNFKYHVLNTIWYGLVQHKNMSIAYKINYFIKLILGKENIIIITTILILIILSIYLFIKKDRRNNFILNNRNGFLLIIISIAATFAALIPSPLWNHYFALPLPFIILFMGFFTSTFSVEIRKVIIILYTICALVSVYFGGSTIFNYINKINKPGEWLTEKIHQEAISAAKLLKEQGLHGKIVTLHPIFPLEAGEGIYNEFSATVFSVRVSPFLNNYERGRYKVALSDSLFKKDPPAAFYIGGIAYFDARLSTYANSKKYLKINEPFKYIEIYTRANKTEK